MADDEAKCVRDHGAGVTSAQAQAATDSPPAATQTRAPVDDLAVDDIIVTAQKREQSLQKQKVPISIKAFDGQALVADSADTIGDLDTITPGLPINDDSVTQPSYSIRGVKTDDFGIGTEPSVGIFMIGVY